ncbi:hypothetical protein GJV82_14270 [Cellulosimicrobium sp. BIT-GX5]|uniref:Uncharacterized protein n=1 Tax=Cellulosimicrobium composti TaxID=2672572 RepID=A0A6N7ZKT2_9MICO|nr:hypothetical protein [Cellulosimicrobium composti]MTG90101.1 hypothetical protein [Cellulosimicrobium composti]
MTVHRASAPSWISALIVAAVVVAALIITKEPAYAVAVTYPVLTALGAQNGRKKRRRPS